VDFNKLKKHLNLTYPKTKIFSPAFMQLQKLVKPA